MDNDPLMNGIRDAPLTRPCNQLDFNQHCQYTVPKEPGIREKLRSNNWTVKTFLVHVFPVLGWLPNYHWKRDFVSDACSGFTVAVMHIPQGMAYSSLAGVPPIVGIYMAFFPVLAYFFFGSSRHVSMGTFAVVCMMAGKPIARYVTTHTDDAVLNTTSTLLLDSSTPTYTPIQVATVVCFTVGVIQVLLGLTRLGSLSVLMSETLISGFTTGAATIVLSSQVKHVLGLKLPRHSGPLKLIHTCIDMFAMIEQTNYLSMAMTLSVILLLYINQKLKPTIQRLSRSNLPLPMELITIILGTVISNYYDLHANYNISIVGNIPTGFPQPTLPPFELLPDVLVDGILIAVVAFSINISMASLFAQKEKYKVDANQELLASGFGNMVGSLFSCLPFAASLSRSLIQYNVGGKTQLASIVSCAILSLVLLYIGPFFEGLPHCVLAGIILFALKGMLKQVADVPVAWKHSRRDGCIWLATFFSVILIDIDFGLAIGLIVSLGIIILMGQHPYVNVMGKLPNTDLYLESDRYHKAVPVPNILILRICGGLHYANRSYVRVKLDKLLRKHLAGQNGEIVTKLVIDMSAVTFMDPASSKAFLDLDSDLKSKGVSLCLANCSGHVFEQLRRSEFFPTFPEGRLFPTVKDAVEIETKET